MPTAWPGIASRRPSRPVKSRRPGRHRVDRRSPNHMPPTYRKYQNNSFSRNTSLPAGSLPTNQRERDIKIAVIGAGAIGGLVGAKLAAAGCDVTFMVRGANLEAIRRRGIRLIASDGSETTVREVGASNDYAAVGAQDVVVLAVKAHQLANVAADAARLVGPRDRRRDHAERNPVLVLPSPWRRARGHGRAQRRSARHPRAPHSAGAGAGLRGVPGLRAGGSGRRRAHRGRPAAAGRARRQLQRAGDADLRVLRRAPASRHRSSTTFAPRSGSSSGAT